MMWLSLALCFSGFTALCLGMRRHHQQLLEDPANPTERLFFQFGGGISLGLAYTPCWISLGPSIGFAFWAAELTGAALAVLLLLSYQPRLIISIALAGPFITLPLAVWQQLAD